MMIETLHGLHATSITLNERFKLLAQKPIPNVTRPKRRSVSQSYSNKSFNYRNQNLIEQIVQQLEQVNQRAIKQRLGLRRYGSDGNLQRLQRSNSMGNLSNVGVKSRLNWRQSNGNLNRFPSFNNLVGRRGRGFKRRGTRMGLTRGKMRGRGGRQQIGRLQNQRIAQNRGRGRPRGRGVTRGTGRGQATTKTKKPVPTKEELDLQLDQYMACTKSALDRDLDTYMESARME